MKNEEIEKAAEKYAKNITDFLDRISAKTDFIAGVRFAQKQLSNEWVSVEERLPDYSTNKGYNVVLVKLRDGMICTATLMQITQHCFENSPILNKWYVFPSMGNDITNEVNHWKEIK